MQKLVLLILWLAMATSNYGQKNIKITQSPAIDALMSKFIKNGKSVESVKGWRIQIVSTSDRREMEQAQSTFASMYPGVAIDWKHIAPYYQVRVGFFESKNKMMPLFLELKKTFPASTYVYDQISKRALVN